MSSSEVSEELLESARAYFKEGKYPAAEPILNQLILQNHKSAEIFHMVGTIYYDQGKFNKAIRAFKRALEIDPAYTDASVGLSIILNDLGRYEEGSKVFEEAQSLLGRGPQAEHSSVNEKFSIKHDELGELYFQHGRFNEALDQYYKALNLSKRKAELTMKIVDCYLKLGDNDRAVRELEHLCKEQPQFVSAKLKLGQLNFEMGQITEAVEHWEGVLVRAPGHPVAERLLRQAQAQLPPPSIENF